MEVVILPVLHDKEKLKKLLVDNNIPLNDAVKRGKFYEEYFDWDYYCKLYQQGKSIRYISRLTNLSYDVVRVNLKKKLKDLRPFTVKGNSKNIFDYDILFPEVNEYGAYLLGWLYSDGSITHNKISIVLQELDYQHLCYIAGLCSDREVIKKKVGVEFNFFSVDLCKLLMEEYNLLPNKSHHDFEIPLDKFNERTIPYLLLGLLEGDGSLSDKHPDFNLLLTNSTWNSLSRVLKDKVGLSHISIRSLNDYGLLCISFRGVSYFSVLEYTYTNTELVTPLERKLNRFKNQIERSANGKTSPYKKLAVNIRDNLNHALCI